ncbi:MAG: 50S ribosomal protein L5 [Planctomycetota bacterium]|nr:50S ribosomal protein L5 [Planctomycetota bacterium]
MARLMEKYRAEVRPNLKESYGYDNVHAVPELRKITLNMGIGKARDNPKHLEEAMRDLGRITGQKAVVTRARKSIAQFHLREGYPVGCRVTLRGKRMWEFLDRLISVTIPRIRDFRGLKDKLDGRGNYSMGLNDQIVFPEVNADNVEHQQGMNIIMTFSGGRDEVSRDLLKQLGFPFRRPEDDRR